MKSKVFVQCRRRWGCNCTP